MHHDHFQLECRGLLAVSCAEYRKTGWGSRLIAKAVPMTCILPESMMCGYNSTTSTDVCSLDQYMTLQLACCRETVWPWAEQQVT